MLNLLFLKKKSSNKSLMLASGETTVAFLQLSRLRAHSNCGLKLLLAAFATASIAALITPIQSFAQTAPNPIRTCAYNPDSGQPNPLGMRAFITAIEQDDDTTFRFDQFPTPVSGQQPGVVIASRRELTFYGVNLEQARQLLLQNPNYYSELLGYSAPEGFASIDAVLACRSVVTDTSQPTPSSSIAPTIQPNSTPQQQLIPTPTPQPTPAPQTLPSPSSVSQTGTTSTISSLPDGNYRYWSGQPSQVTVTDEELLRAGGYLFIFRKIGNQIIGRLNHIDSEDTMCIVGLVNGNTVAGFAYPGNANVTYLGENFTQWGPAPYLQIRWGQRRGRQSRYDSALLNLNGFSRISAGIQLPPQSCP
jgi:hypothetical protein